MIADALTNPPRSLVQYAKELREQIALAERQGTTDSLWHMRRTLLAIEREINWRAGI